MTSVAFTFYSKNKLPTTENIFILGGLLPIKILFSTKESNSFLIAEIHLFESGEFTASE